MYLANYSIKQRCEIAHMFDMKYRVQEPPLLAMMITCDL